MPRDTNLLLTRARIYLASENFPAADRDLKKVLKLDPSSAEAHYYRGILRLQQEEVQQAIEHFTAAIELRGDDARFYRRRAGLYLLQSDTEQALADYEKLIELRQADASTYNLLAWWYATLDHDHLRNGAKAVEYATRACELTQFKQWAYVDTLAAAYAEANDFTNAVKYQEQAISLGGDDVQEGLKERLEQYRLKRPYREARIDS
jgi:tetratricopeptide (TPR) repeat protein